MMAASAPGEGSEHKLMTFAKTFDTNDIRRRIVQELASVFDKGTPVPTPEDLQKMFDALDNQENVEISDVHLKKMLRYVDDQKEFARNFAPLFYTEGYEHDVSKVIIYLKLAHNLYFRDVVDYARMDEQLFVIFKLVSKRVAHLCANAYHTDKQIRDSIRQMNTARQLDKTLTAR